jgi:putative pyruvate formate lyase activating enzyme
MMQASYLELYNSGELEGRIEEAFGLLKSCSLCPRRCGINRLENKSGFCKTGIRARVYSYMAHMGEEPCISGSRGSGTIFFSGCNMTCVYCQNYEFSQSSQGKEVETEELAGLMLELQEIGCHNINLVTPTHIMPQILKALSLAIAKGLTLPIVYNTGGYELPEAIRLLEGIVDIFLADMRYAQEEAALDYSNAPAYPEYNRAAVKQMHRQVGVAQIDKQGIINKGLVIRHLVLPENISGTEEIMRFITRELSPQTYVSLMSQYHPYYKAGEFPALSRRIFKQEYELAREAMQRYGLCHGWIQEGGGLEHFAGINIKPRR